MVKKFEVDTNFNWLGPNKPALSHEEANLLELVPGDIVLVFQDDDEWSAVVDFDPELPHMYQWYVVLQLPGRR